MLPESIWINGPTRSGKTACLIQHLCDWIQTQRDFHAAELGMAEPENASQEVSRRPNKGKSPTRPLRQPQAPGILVLAAIGDNRLQLTDRIVEATRGRPAVNSTTPQGFFRDEVMLFFPLLIARLNLPARFPLQLRPENEQELATRLWRSFLEKDLGVRLEALESRLVRQVLDLLQLASLAGVAVTEIPTILAQGLAPLDNEAYGQTAEFPLSPDRVGELLALWQSWCLERGLLTYGIMAGLYGQHLLPDPTYQQHLAQRYQLVLADDVDEYPAISRHLLEVLLDQGAKGVFTHNPDGAVRLGLGADPHYLAGLAGRCQVESLPQSPTDNLGETLHQPVLDLVSNPIFFANLPDTIQTIQTTSRAQLLRQVSEVIVAAVKSHQVEPQEIAVIAPGMDAIARYALGDILNKQQIAVESLHDQRPLVSTPMIRALLTLLTLIYPGLGRLVSRDAVAEMLVVLSQKFRSESPPTPEPPDFSELLSASALSASYIDPVRAGLLADHCFEPHLEQPRLLPVETFSRWDRLGYQATERYRKIVQWIEEQKIQQEQRLIPSPVSLIDRAIQRFLMGGSYLPTDQLAALRELLETAQHYWEVDTRLQQSARQRTELAVSGGTSRFSPTAPLKTHTATTVANFIQLLRKGTVTANPFPVRAIAPATPAVTLANVFQYRSHRPHHRWQFWLDVGSSRWLTGIDALFGYPLFLQNWSGRPLTADETLAANEQRLHRILKDLLSRTGDRLFLCHSDLATNGQEQMGPLLTLVNAAIAVDLQSVEPS